MTAIKQPGARPKKRAGSISGGKTNKRRSEEKTDTNQIINRMMHECDVWWGFTPDELKAITNSYYNPVGLYRLACDVRGNSSFKILLFLEWLHKYSAEYAERVKKILGELSEGERASLELYYGLTSGRSLYKTFESLMKQYKISYKIIKYRETAVRKLRHPKSIGILANGIFN